MYPRIKKLIFFATAILSIAAFPFVTEARGLVSSDDDPLIPLCAITDGSCQPCDIIQLVANIIDLLIGALGVVLLIMFVVGGITLLLSQGNSDKISKGTGTMKNAVIGAIIVMLAWTIVNVTIGALTGADFKGKDAMPIFGDTPWNICDVTTADEN
ncbi:MAG: hypothetical protein HOA84_00240 [Candidatus Jacksonbacteria bacterium]|nr:hypothetical protein [Candidatus Jacksonbacteria bacterium]